MAGLVFVLTNWSVCYQHLTVGAADEWICRHRRLRCRAPPRGVTLHILRALRSDRWDHDTLALVRGAAAGTAQPAALRGQTRYHELADAGHWVSALPCCCLCCCLCCWACSVLLVPLVLVA